MRLLEALKSKVLTADGAMGTLLYSYGLDNCHEEMNLVKPDVIEKIHREYIAAGADVIQTNTYGANAIKLARYGLESKVVEINAAAIAIAKMLFQMETNLLLVQSGAFEEFERVILL